MTTYRERREARVERLEGWAASRAATASAAHERVHAIADGIPFGQPILVGHHSERHARRDQSRMENGMRAAIDNERMSERHASRALNIQAQLDASIYDDDPDATERLSEKLAAMEAARERYKAANAAYRKEHRDELKAMTPYARSQAVPYPSYAITNLGGNISRTRKRLEHLRYVAASVAAGKRPGYGKRMVSRYGGTCPDCGEDFDRGDSIVYYRATREALCASCGEKGGK